MGIKERLHNIAKTVNIETDEGCGYHDGLMRAADHAAEADELMAEMAEALKSYAKEDFGYKIAKDALDRYNQYKDQTND